MPSALVSPVIQGIQVSSTTESLSSRTYRKPCFLSRAYPPQKWPHGGVLRAQPCTTSISQQQMLAAESTTFQDKAASLLKQLWSKTSLNHWIVNDYLKLVQDVNFLEASIHSLTDNQLKERTYSLRERVKHGESLNNIQSEAFAVVREAARRTLGMRHFDVQIIGGAVLHDGGIAEMKTGEGKTLVSTLAAYLNALTDKGVHVVTVNDYLAQRDADWMGQIHRFLGLSVGLIQSGMGPHERQLAYACDITYANNSEIGFDYLRDHTCQKKDELVMRWPEPFNFAIVDEVDSVLIDEGRNPLLISAQSTKNAARYPVAAEVADFLVVDRHYTVRRKEKDVELTEEGVAMSELALGIDDLWNEKDPWAWFIVRALKAKECYVRDVDYIVKGGHIQIVDEFTGRIMDNRRWSDGIHQAVEAKEGLNINPEAVTVAQITYQSYFKLYPKLSGMTGTAKTEEKEFLKLFNMPVVEVPTNLPNIRQDLPLQVFPTARAKWKNVREEVEYMYAGGRPVLVGTTSVEESEHLSALLHEFNIPHNVLNARPKYAAREAEIVAQAGRKRSITIATNMAGRGTDIILGGNPEMLAKEIIQDRVLPFMTEEEPNIDTDGAPLSQMALSKVVLTASSQTKISRAISAARFLCGRGEAKWSYREAKSQLMSALEIARIENGDQIENLTSNFDLQSSTLATCIAIAYSSVLHDCLIHCQYEGDEVKRLGGLHVIGTALHESRRIDNQLRGRSGRQGDPGSTRFMISCQDEMLQKYGGEFAYKFLSSVGADDLDVDIAGDFLRRQLLAIQTSAERFYSTIRRNLVQYDEVLEVHRRHVYSLRESLVTGDSEICRQRYYQYMQGVADEIVFKNADSHKDPSLWNIESVLSEFNALALKTFSANHQSHSHVLSNVTKEMLISSIKSVDKIVTSSDNFTLPGLPPPGVALHGFHAHASSMKRWLEIVSDDSVTDGKYQREVHLLRKYMGDILVAAYENKLQVSQLRSEDIRQVERILGINALDHFWRIHLVNMNRLLSAVQVRSFGRMNPLEEYKIDGARFFIGMLSSVRRMTVESLLQPWLSTDQDIDPQSSL